MIDSITRITLNLQETNTMVSIRAKRGDTGRKLLIHLSDGSIPYHISDDCYATFTAKKPDGTKINNACTIENNVIEYEFTDQTCTAVGTMKAEIRLYGADDKMITSACFLVNVYDTVFRDGDEVGSETEMNTLDDLILRANAFLNETGKLLRWQGNWDSEAEYEANDLVLHEEVLYVAEEAIAAGTAPGSEEVTAWVPIAGMGTGSGADLTEQVDRAEAAAQNAESAAATANNARAQAQAAANSAGVYVGNAVAAMNNANAAAATAEAAKESASTSVNLAGGYASTAHSSANQAEQAKNSAQGYASSASSSATRAEEAAARAEEAAAEAGNGSGGNAGFVVQPTAPEDTSVLWVDPDDDTEDGSQSGGIAVTGATVGQTVKIAAVDEKGVPTAWESVDFPSGSGGEEWELINSVVTEEEVEAMFFEVDSDGNPFSLKKALFIEYLAPYTGEETFAGFMFAMRNGSGNTVLYSGAPAASKTNWQSLMWLVESNDNFTLEQWSKGSYGSALQFADTNVIAGGFTNNGVMNHLKILGHTRSIGVCSSIIPVGSIFHLYGVRA